MPLRDYKLTGDWVNTGESGAGNGKFIIGAKGGKRFFIKELDFFVRRGSEFPRAQRDVDNPIFDKTFKYHETMKSELANIGVTPDSTVSVPVEVTTKPFLKHSETLVLITRFVEDLYLPKQSDEARVKSISLLTIAQKHYIFLSAIQNLEKIHRVKIIHSDLKPGNILVCKKDGKFFTNLIDFDAFFFHGQSPNAVTMSNGYETPEGIYFNEKMDGIGPDVLTTSLDIFSLAIIIHEYFTGVKPDIGAEPNVAMAVIRNQPVRMHPSLETTKIYHNAKVSYASLLNWMLDFNYKNRPSAIQILKILSGTSFDIPLAYLTKEDKVTRFTIDRLFEDHEPFFKFKTQSELQTLGVNSITRANNGIHYHVSQAGLSKQMSLKDLVKLGYVSRYHRPPLPVIPDFRFVAQDKLESLGIYHLHFDDTKNMFGIYYYDKKVFYANKDTLFYSLNIIEKVAGGKPKPLESSISPTLGKDKPVEFCTPFPEHNITFNEDSARKLNIVKITRNEAEKKYFIYKSGSEQPTNTFVDTLIMNRVGVKKK